jgi:hypothetical protein
MENHWTSTVLDSASDVLGSYLASHPASVLPLDKPKNPGFKNEKPDKKP